MTTDWHTIDLVEPLIQAAPLLSNEDKSLLASIGGLLSEEEGEKLAEIAARAPEGLPIVEIGSYLGKSTCYLATTASAKVYAIDLWDMKLPTEIKKTKGKKQKTRNKNEYAYTFEGTPTYKAFLANIKKAGVAGKVEYVKGDAKEHAKTWKSGSQPIGVLFIDGAHSIKSVTADYDLWSPFIVGGGFIAFHDADGGKVRRVIEEHVMPQNLWEDWELTDRLMVARRKA